MRRWICLLCLMGCTEENLAPSEPLVSLTPHDPVTTRDLQVFFLTTSTKRLYNMFVLTIASMFNKIIDIVFSSI